MGFRGAGGLKIGAVAMVSLAQRKNEAAQELQRLSRGRTSRRNVAQLRSERAVKISIPLQVLNSFRTFV